MGRDTRGREYSSGRVFPCSLQPRIDFLCIVSELDVPGISCSRAQPIHITYKLEIIIRETRGTSVQQTEGKKWNFKRVNNRTAIICTRLSRETARKDWDLLAAKGRHTLRPPPFCVPSRGLLLPPPPNHRKAWTESRFDNSSVLLLRYVYARTNMIGIRARLPPSIVIAPRVQLFDGGNALNRNCTAENFSIPSRGFRLKLNVRTEVPASSFRLRFPRDSFQLHWNWKVASRAVAATWLLRNEIISSKRVAFVNCAFPPKTGWTLT